MTESEAYTLLLNANYNELYIEKCLRELKNCMFNECNSYIESLCSIKRFNGNIADFKISREINIEYGLRDNSYATTIEFDFINFFKKRNFNNINKQVLDIEFINSSRELFKYKALFFIDGYLMQEVFFIPKNELTVIVIQPKKNNDIVLNKNIMKSLIEKNAKWSLILEPHTNFSKAYKIHSRIFNSNGVSLLNTDNTIIKTEVLNNWKCFSSLNSLPKYFLIGSLATKADKFLSISTNYINYTRQNTDNTIFFAYNENNLYYRYITNIKSKIDLAVPNNDSSLEKINLPIPKNNIIMWKEDKDDCIKLIHDYDIEILYPNIYSISINENISDNDSKIIIDFYYSYTNEIDFYNLFFNYIKYIGIDNFKNNSLNKKLPSCMQSYIPKNFIYNYNDYLKTQKEDSYPTKIYKKDKIKEYMNENIWKFRDYCIDIENYNYSDIINSWIISCKTSPWLLTRSRRDNISEISNIDKQESFNEEFSFIKMSTSCTCIPDLCIWIDGLRVLNFKVYNELYMNYIYIPRKLIKENSIIEIETYTNNQKFDQISTADNSESMISLEFNKKYIKPMDILVIDYETKEYLTNDDYDIIISTFDIKKMRHRFRDTDELEDELYLSMEGTDSDFEYDDNGMLIINMNTDSILLSDGITTSNYYILNKFSARSFDIDYLKIIIKNKKFYKKKLQISTIDKTIISSHIFEIEQPTKSKIVKAEINFPSFKEKSSLNRFRMFHNGHYINPDGQVYNIQPASKYNDDTRSHFYLFNESEAELSLEYLPFDFNLIYHKKTIDNSGVIKLKDYLNRPFDLAYYTVYLNGRKLNFTNIQVISENIIRIRNVQSVHNLYIYERNMDEDIFNYNSVNFHSSHEELLYNDKNYFNYIINDSIIKSQEDGYIDDNGYIDDLEVDIENNIKSDMDELIQKTIIQFIPILPDKDQLEGDDYLLAQTRFIPGTTRYRVNPDGPLNVSDKIINRNPIIYNVDSRIDGENKIKADMDELIQKTIIQFIPILPDKDQLYGDSYLLAKPRFVPGTTRYEVNPDGPLNVSDKIINRNPIIYNVDSRKED